MSLTLKAIDPTQPDGTAIHVTMTADAITVGRGVDNDLVLPDPDRVLSKRHCIVTRQGDSYLVTDVSTNGTFLNYQPDRLGTAPTPLSAGDVILVGAFELVVDIETVSVGRVLTAPVAPAGATMDPAPLAGINDDDSGFLQDLLGDPAAAPQGADSDPFAMRSSPQPGASTPDHTPAQKDHFAAPRALNAIIPDNWDESVAAPPHASSPPPPPPASAAAQGAQADKALRAFIDGLGVSGLQIPPDQAEETMARMGRVMAAMIAGLRDVMMTRAALKSEMRVARTMIGADQNNPLKFSVNVEQAITAMIRPAGQGYQDAETATAEVLRDIKAHEIATMTGMQAALKDLLTQLGPEQLSARIEKTSGFAALLGNSKARSWEAYERHHAQLARQTEDDFQSTFGKEFSRAYEHQITKL